LNHGEYAGDQIISEALTAEALREHFPGQRFGWKAAGDFAFAEGDTGTIVWINPQQKLACALLTNASYYGDGRATLEKLKGELIPTIQQIIEEA
jgi:CubicO group peptidase (beta-lactamase class C family)